MLTSGFAKYGIQSSDVVFQMVKHTVDSVKYLMVWSNHNYLSAVVLFGWGKYRAQDLQFSRVVSCPGCDEILRCYSPSKWHCV